ncbi:hypothetical protein Dimus_028373 [Dionaea muscipula]
MKNWIYRIKGTKGRRNQFLTAETLDPSLNLDSSTESAPNLKGVKLIRGFYGVTFAPSQANLIWVAICEYELARSHPTIQLAAWSTLTSSPRAAWPAAGGAAACAASNICDQRPRWLVATPRPDAVRGDVQHRGQPKAAGTSSSSMRSQQTSSSSIRNRASTKDNTLPCGQKHPRAQRGRGQPGLHAARGGPWPSLRAASGDPRPTNTTRGQ